ncbi:hypothetical protein [Marinospirillum insulare]|uniref:Uncharacterized protein n=1 Tax=Marinospirillum insulare TaxID=217169 RepID=A0ABQ5ZVK0_9GAMM|nr:hypothetical protein [Marinospirillum insulare]GLR63060.1 hypothetical protein GCM10007878_04950 [Marinospirillum insulare]
MSISTNQPKAILLPSIQRTSTDLMDLLHYYTEPVTLLVPATFFDAASANKLVTDLVSVKPLQSKVTDRSALLSEYEKKVKQLDFSGEVTEPYQKEVKALLERSLPVSLELIDALEEAQEDYQLIGFFTSNEAFPRERIMRDWSSQQGVPTLHINHGLILSEPGGAYWDFATDVMTTACPNEVDSLQHAFNKLPNPPKLEITGMPSWDKYALLTGEAQIANFRAHLGLTINQQLVTFFPTFRNTSLIHDPKLPDPHLKGIQNFIALAAKLIKSLPETVFIIKDRPGNQQFMDDFVALEASKQGLTSKQLRYVFDHAEPYVASSTLVLSPKSTISSEAILCEVPYIHIFEELWEPFAYGPEAQVAHTHTSEAVEFVHKLLTQPNELEAIREAQRSSNQLTGPGRDFCSSLRVARVMAELIGEAHIVEQIDADLQAWAEFLAANPTLSTDDLLNNANNPLRFHWRNVQKLLTFDERFSEEDVYSTWLKHKEALPVDEQLMTERMQTMWHSQPSFHLIYIVDASLFGALANSLVSLDNQAYQHYGISIISSAACPDESLLTLSNLQWIVAEQPFDKLNTVINEVESDWVILLQPGDQLLPDALFNFADYANFKPDWLAIYADEDHHDSPNFKPDFNHELLLSTNYIGQCVALRRDAILGLEGLSSLAYVQNEDFLLRLTERMNSSTIGHIPMIANHRGSVLDETLKSEIVEMTGSLIRQEHLQRCGHKDIEVLPGLKPVTWQVKYPLTNQPSVVLLLPILEWHEAVTDCIQSILQTTSYPNWKLCLGAPKELINSLPKELVNSELIETIELGSTNSKVAAYTQLAATQPNADFYCLLESDIHCVQLDWLERLVMHGQRPKVALVAPRLVRPSGRIFSAGQVLGMNGDVDDLFQNFHLEQDLNNQPRAWCDQNFSALNASCVLISRKNFETFGLNTNYPNCFYLADLGLRMQLKGLNLHWTPYANVACQGLIKQQKDELKHKELPSLYKDWFDVLTHDPAHNLNLELRNSGHLPQISLVTTWHPAFRQQLRVLLVPLHIDSNCTKLIGTLGYFLKEIEENGKVRISSSTIELLAKDYELPNLIELARADADLVIFFGEEVGFSKGLAKQLKSLTECKVAVYTEHTLANTSWADYTDAIDIHFSADSKTKGAVYIPKVDKKLQKQAITNITKRLEQAILG